MPDEDDPAFEAGTAGAEAGTAGAAAAGGAQPGDERGFDTSSLFVHEADASAEALQHDVDELFEHPIPPDPAPDPEPETPQDPDQDLHLMPAPEHIDTADVHLFDKAESESRPDAHAFPAPVPARPEQHHTAPLGIGRVQLIAIAVGLVVAALGVWWALTTRSAPAPVTGTPSANSAIAPERVAKADQPVDVLTAAAHAVVAEGASGSAPGL